jgi:sugar (pentulose or hexulose) kinase
VSGSLVGLDVSTTGVKAVAGSPDGHVLARAEERSSGCRCATTEVRSFAPCSEGVAYGLRDSLELLRQLGVSADRGRVAA